jgi:hypothetical protein
MRRFVDRSSGPWARLALWHCGGIQLCLQSVPVRITKSLRKSFVGVGLLQDDAGRRQKFPQTLAAFLTPAADNVIVTISQSSIGRRQREKAPLSHLTVPEFGDAQDVLSLQLCLTLTGGAGPALQYRK